jgi:hypothetical protein
MGDPPFSPVAVNAMRNKRADLAGQIEMHNREIDRLRSALVHLDATLRLFDPYIQPDEIASRKRWPRRTDYFARGELTRLVFDAIREHGTTAAGELAAAAMTARSIPESDNQIRRDFVTRFPEHTTRPVAARHGREDRSRARSEVEAGDRGQNAGAA